MPYAPAAPGGVRRAEPMGWDAAWPKMKKALITFVVIQAISGKFGSIDDLKKMFVGEKIDLKTDITGITEPSASADAQKNPSLAEVARSIYDAPVKPELPELPPYKPLWWPVSYVEADLSITVTGGLNEPTVEYSLKLDKNFDVTKPLTVTVPGSFNGTLVGNVQVKRRDGGETYESAFNLTDYKVRKGPKKLKNLLSGETDDSQENLASDVILPYYSPNVTLGLVYGDQLLPFTKMPWTMVKHYTVDHDRQGYYPAVFHNKFWQLESQLVELNSTEPVDLLFNIEVYKLTVFYFQMLAGITNPDNQQGGAGELESVKKVLLDTNPYLLAVTFSVTLLHMLFEFLAFKSDISHWRNKKDNVGVSVRSIIANVFMQAVILLYLIDNSEETNYMILMSQGFGILVEAWKVTKVWNRPEEDKSEIEKQTEEYDGIAFKYMYIGAVPLILAYAGYSLKYETHKSWYSFVIATLVGSVYAYGFLMLLPSIYINYRLKSVAHIPRKAMVYKFLNTFIDDLFAFVIKMPWLHRLATLRDDVVFFIFIYQTYLYRVDYRRVNEFGQGGEDDEKEKNKTSEFKSLESSSTKKVDKAPKKTDKSPKRKDI